MLTKNGENSWYKILGVKSSSSDVEVRSAYRNLILIHHPDKGGDAKKFRLIIAAYKLYKLL